MTRTVKCPNLIDLPVPSVSCKTGWPWTEESNRLPDKRANGEEWPTISVIIPSFNQGRFIEETIRSILLQGYPRIEIIIIDGGSKDETVDIIKKYERWISYWVSEPDKGQSDALNKGISRATGEYIGWQNSDDIYLPNAFSTLIMPLIDSSKYQLAFGNLVIIDEHGNFIREQRFTKFSTICLMFEGWNISNQSAIWRKSLQDRIGLFNNKYNYEMDLDFFLRAAMFGDFKFIHKQIGCLRVHPQAKTQHIFAPTDVIEGDLIRAKYMNPFSRIFILPMRYFCLIRRMIYYLFQGDIDYIFRGLQHRLLKK